MAELDENDPADSGAASADPSSTGGLRRGGRAGGSHPLGAEPTDGVEFDSTEPDGLLPDALLSDADDSNHDLGLDDTDKELVAVGAPADKLVERTGAGRDAGAVARSRSKKVKSTPRQKQVAESERRTGPVTFLREAIGELQKVVYPTGQQLLNYFVVVLIFVLFIIAIVSLLDLAFGKAILAVFS